MSRGVDQAERMLEYLKQIYPNSATREEIFSELGVKACTGDTWLKTLVVSRDIEVSGKQGRHNLYRYKKE